MDFNPIFQAIATAHERRRRITEAIEYAVARQGITLLPGQLERLVAIAEAELKERDGGQEGQEV